MDRIKVEFVVRAAISNDVSQIFSLIQALASYENLTDQMTGTEAALAQHLFGNESKLVEAIVVEAEEKILGFALFFQNYSTFLTQPGIYLEDLFVLPEYRGQGMGRALLTHLAKLASDRNCGRLEWSVLDWNQSAIGFYKHMGAKVSPDWRICRLNEAKIKKIVASN
jgi:GNAT superfamily N-acetyltransferase